MRVLIVEDELRIAKAIKRSLNSEHLAVDIVSDGNSGMSYALSSDYDAIILDRMLPGNFNGMDICRRLRQEKVETPILMLTALGELDDRLTGLKDGADDYMVKPFSMSELVQRVKVLLRRPSSLKGPIIKASDLEINIESFEVKRSQKKIKLSPREFKLLAYLAQNIDQTISKEILIRHAWDDDADIVINTVEVYIGNLRRKIDKPFFDSPPLIHTIHGFGYRFGMY